jgi:hypothetical protein
VWGGRDAQWHGIGKKLTYRGRQQRDHSPCSPDTFCFLGKVLVIGEKMQGQRMGFWDVCVDTAMAVSSGAMGSCRGDSGEPGGVVAVSAGI